MRIAVVSPYALDVPGGVQQQVIGLVEQLRRLGEDAYSVAPGAGEATHRVDVGRWVGVRVNRSQAPLALSPGVIRRVRAAVSMADVVHVHEPFVPLVGWAALRTGKPTVVTFHADPSEMVKTAYRWASGMLRRALRSCLATTVSGTALGAVEPLGVSPEVIPNALDVASFRLGVERNPRQVAFVGRPDPRKGRDLLLAAWPAVRTRVPDASLVILGGGDTPPVAGVSYLGRVTEEEKRLALASSGVFCAPNRGGESFGIAVAEGMAAGCAVVASDLTAFADVLDGSGLMFRKDDRGSLAAGLVRVLSDGDLRHRLAVDASARVRAFDWERVTDRYTNLYERAISRMDRGPGDE